MSEFFGNIVSITGSQQVPDTEYEFGTLLDRVKRRADSLIEDQASWISEWKQIGKYINTNGGRFDAEKNNNGGRRDLALVDPSPQQYLNILASGMQGGLTSPSRMWFKLDIADMNVEEYGPIRAWLDEVERRMARVMNRSNIYNAFHSSYAELGAFGTCAMILEEDDRTVIRCIPLTVGEYCIGLGADLRVDTFYERVGMTAWQMYKQFGIENLSESVKKALDNKKPDEQFLVEHIICENEERILGDETANGMPYASLWWENGGKKFLKKSGYREFPVMAPRWDVTSRDTYGRGPGWYALGESKMLQEMKSDYLRGNKLNICPPLLSPLSSIRQRIDMTPGAINPVDSETMQTGAVRPLFSFNQDLQGQIAAMNMSQNIMRAIFYVDLFLMMASSSREMTATEVAQKQEEKMVVLGPVLDRIGHEMLNPIIARVFAIMDRRGLIPPPPEDIVGRSIEIEYISVLAQAQKMVGLSGLERFTQYAGGVAQLSPEAMDRFNPEEAVFAYGKMIGVPGTVIRTTEQVAALRQQRAEEAAMAQQMAMIQATAAAAKDGAAAAKDGVSAAAESMNSGVGDQLAGMMGNAQGGV